MKKFKYILDDIKLKIRAWYSYWFWMTKEERKLYDEIFRKKKQYE
jgi:hypothetical protein